MGIKSSSESPAKTPKALESYSASTENYISSHQYPEVLVLSITMHGELSDVTGNEVYLPEGLSVFKINASPPYLCNILDSEQVLRMHSSIERLLPCGNVMERLTGRGLQKVAEDIQRGLRARQNEILMLDTLKQNVKDKKLKSERRSSPKKSSKTDELSSSEASVDSEIEEFINLNTYFEMQECTGKVMINKIFERTAKDTKRAHKEDMSITAINMAGHPDLINEIYARKGRAVPGLATTTTKELLEFVAQRRIKGVIIVDFSCNSFSKTLTSSEKQIKTKKISSSAATLAYGGAPRK